MDDNKPSQIQSAPIQPVTFQPCQTQSNWVRPGQTGSDPAKPCWHFRTNNCVNPVKPMNPATPAPKQNGPPHLRSPPHPNTHLHLAIRLGPAPHHPLLHHGTLSACSPPKSGNPPPLHFPPEHCPNPNTHSHLQSVLASLPTTPSGVVNP